jgi:hypothetical protein
MCPESLVLHSSEMAKERMTEQRSKEGQDMSGGSNKGKKMGKPDPTKIKISASKDTHPISKRAIHKMEDMFANYISGKWLFLE